MSHRFAATAPARIAGVLLLGALTTAAGCSNGTKAAPEQADTSVEPTSAPVATDLTSLRLPREEFCDRIPESLLGDTLGAVPALEQWRNGDPLPGSGTGAIGHEYGCRWTGATASAAAWVYAPPTDASGAKRWGEQLLKHSAKGCRGTQDAAAFGRHPVAQQCRGSKATGPTTTWAGLFGDAWLVCSWTGPRAAAQASELCPALATAAAV